jgi:Fe(3+) dicitrate transport protein
MPSPPIGFLVHALCIALFATSASAAQQENPKSKTKTDPKAKTVQQDPVADEILVIGRVKSDGVPVVPLNYPASRDILNPETVRAIGARDLNDLLLQLPTVATRPYNGGEASAPSFGARGLPDDGLTEYLHVLINGVPANSAPYGWTAFSFMPITSERVYAIDNIRGGHTVRYSPNTVGGVINFVTRPIPEQFETDFRQSFGTQGFSSSFLTGGTTTAEGTGFRFSFLDREGDGYRRNGGFKQQDFNFELRQALDDGAWIASSFGWFNDDHAAPGGLTRAEFDADRWANSRPENRFDGFRSLIDVVYHVPEGDDWYEIYTQASVTERNLYARRVSGGASVLDDWHDQTYFANVGLRGERGFDFAGTKHVLNGGVRVHREWLPSYAISRAPFGTTAFTPRTNSSFRLLSLSAHIDDTFYPTPDLLITAGVRTEFIPSTSGSDDVTGFRYEDSFFDVLPAIGMSYTLNDQAAAFLNYGEGFRAPQFWGFAYTTNPSDTLKFESGRTSELGLRLHDIGPLSGSIAAWQLDFSDYLVFDTGFYENIGRIKSQGIDFDLALDCGKIAQSLEGLRFTTAFTLQNSELKTGVNAGNEVPYAWKSKATWRAIYSQPSGFYASVGGAFIGESFSDEANTVAESADGRLGVNRSAIIWDAQVAYDFELADHATLQLAVGATNLFDKEWEVHSRGGFFGPGLVAGAPRQAYATVMVQVL